MQKLIEQIYSTEEDLECEKCKGKHGHFVSLTCDHKYCVLCLSFMYAKHRKLDPKEGTVKCIKCDEITELHPSHLEIVTSTLKEQVFPNIEEESHAGLSRNGFSLQHSIIGGRKIKSEEQSFEHNTTPSGSKGFFSKCESPSSFKNLSSKMTCSTHRNEPITHICFSCHMCSLCIKCISGTKKHQNHEIKDIQKTLSIMSEQAEEVKMELNINASRFVNHLKKLDERGAMIQRRCEKSIDDIAKSFDNLVFKIKQKQEEIVEICHENMEELLVQNDSQINLVSEHLEQIKKLSDKVNFLEKESEKGDFIFLWSQTKEEYIFLKGINFEDELNSKIKLPSNTIFKDIDQFTNQFSNLNVKFKHSNLSRVGVNDLENCRSESKFRKDSKRLKTNFVSLNSSRERKVKKNTKTEEDERRLMTEKVGIERDKKSSKVPAYISDYINKKNIKFGSDGSPTLEATSPNIENSKIISKLSKTLCPEELTKKKKDNMALIKERIERKSTQPLIKKAESSKKKKGH